MDYVKDEFGNIIGYKGDDLSQQQAKLAGIPQGQVPVQGQQVAQPEAVPTAPNNLFAKPSSGVPALDSAQEAGMTYTDKELEAGRHLPNGGVAKTPQSKDLVTNGGIAGNNGKMPQYGYQPRPRITNMDELASAMGYTSPEEEARLRKASVNNQRILAVADALRHIGNIANTVNYAPAQRFNQPWAEEQVRYEHGKAQRDRANQVLFSYQRQKADQERAERKLDAQIKKQEKDAERAERWNQARIDRIYAQNAKTEEEAKFYQTRARLQEEGWPLEKANKEAQIQLKKAQTELTNLKIANGGSAPRKSSGGGRRSGGSNGGKYWAYDEEGNIHYYPNKTMYEQGVEQFSKGLSNSETYSGTDSNGRTQQKSTRRKIVSKGGELARNAQNMKKYSNTAKLLGRFKKNK